jgi:hypothetical protein
MHKSSGSPLATTWCSEKRFNINFFLQEKQEEEDKYKSP